MNTSNFINIIGRLGQAPIRKTLPGGSEIMELSVATNNFYRDRNGDRVKATDWHRVKCFSPQVMDLLERYTDKGDQISIVGSMRYHTWTDKYEQKRREAEVILDSFSFLSSGRRNDAPAADYQSAAPAATPPSMPAPTYAGSIQNEPAMTDDLPF